MWLANAFLAVTHGIEDPGGADGIRSSFGDDLLWNEISNYVDTNRVVPLYNCVVFYVCSGGAGETAAYRFHLQIAQRRDRAFFGFKHPVSENLGNGAGTLDLHALQLTRQLRGGKTGQEAVDSANALYPPMNVDGIHGEPMQLDPTTDKWFRLVRVYRTEEEQQQWTSIENQSWFHVFE